MQPALALVLLFVLLWVSSGTLAPYAVTLDEPVVDEACGYLYNLDHTFHLAQYRMLDGEPRHTWAYSPVLRRVLYPILAFPFMKVLGDNAGGLAINFLLNAVAILVFVRFVRKEVGGQAGSMTLWLLATYPGIAYWGSLPYAYAFIVPATLLCGMLLYYLARAETMPRILLLAAGMGLLFTGYDLYIFFLPAVGLVLLMRRKWVAIPLASVAIMLPTVLVMLAMAKLCGVGAANDNTNIYGVVLKSYFGPYNMTDWTWLLKTSPMVGVHNFLFSNFLFLPLGFLICWILRAIKKQGQLQALEWSLLVAAAVLWAFNNFAPPYEGWQMRGTWIARMYQPMFVAMVFFIVRSAPPRGLVIALVVAQASVCLGGVLHLPHSGLLYHHFYQHAEKPMYQENLETHGRRPLGFCQPVAEEGAR